MPKIAGTKINSQGIWQPAGKISMYDILINSMAVKVKQKIEKTKKSNRIKSACLYGYFRRFQHGHFLKTLYFFFQACGTTKKEKRLLASAMENLLQ